MKNLNHYTVKMLNDIRHMTNINQRKLKETTKELTEAYWLNYALEALKPIEFNVSEGMYKIAAEMAENIKLSLYEKEIFADIYIIGSLAANTHIKCGETIDLLILFKGYQYTISAPHKSHNHELVDIILLRDYITKYLKMKFPDALLDDSQTLALKMSNKKQPYNFCFYFGYEHMIPDQDSGNFSSQANFKLLNYIQLTFEDSNPFSVISELKNKDLNTNGNTKALIRLIKNLKADAFEHITLTGHQIASIIYTIDDNSLAKPPGYILFLLLEVSLSLKKLTDNPFALRSLRSPDDFTLLESYNENSFIHGINQLKTEIDSLIKHLVLEIDLYTDIYSKASINH